MSLWVRVGLTALIVYLASTIFSGKEGEDEGIVLDVVLPCVNMLALLVFLGAMIWGIWS